MTRILTLALVLALPLAAGLAGPVEADTPEKALCRVCHVMGGETEPERVAASVVHEGTTYHFCADHCKAAFLEDPLAFVLPVLPRPAPAFTVEALDGTKASLDTFAGKLVLLDFWATWCKPCTTAMPKLAALHERHAAKGFTVVGVSIDEGDTAAKTVQKFLQKKPVSYPTFLATGDEPAWAAFRVRSVPAAFLIDAKGQVVAQWLGRVSLDEVEAEIAKRIDTTR